MEQKPKILIPFWRLVANYYLSSVIALPLLGYIAVAIAIILSGLTPPVSVILLLLASFVSTWYGCGYGARYVMKRYVIEHPAKLVKWATITLVALQLLGIVISGALAISGADTQEPFSWGTFATDVIGDVILIAVFYYGSRKYLLTAPKSA